MAFSRKLVPALTQFSSFFQLENRSPNFIFSENCALQEARVTSVSPCSGGLSKNEPPQGLCSVVVGEESLKLQKSLLLKPELLPPTSLGNGVPPPVPFPEAQHSVTKTRRAESDAQIVAK